MSIKLMHMSGRVAYVFAVSDMPVVPISLHGIEIEADRVFITWEQKPGQMWVMGDVEVAGRSSRNGGYVQHLPRTFDWPEWLTQLIYNSHPNPSNTIRF